MNTGHVLAGAAVTRAINLEQAINMALAHNRQLLDARDAFVSSRYSLESSEADFKIQISPTARAGFSGSSSQNAIEDLGLGLTFYKRLPWGTELSATPNFSRTDDTYQSSVDFEITQPLLRGFGKQQAMSGVYAARYSERITRRNLYLTEIETVIRTVRAIYNCVKLKEELRQNHASYQRLKRHRQTLAAKARTGYSPSIDAYRVELELSQAEDAVVQSREAYGDSKDELKMLLDIPLEQDIEATAPLEFSEIRIDPQEAVKNALENRIEIKQAMDAVKEARRLSYVAEKNTWPQLDVVVKYGRLGYGGAISQSLGLDDHYWAISLVSTTDFFRRKEKLAYKQSLLNVNTSLRRYSLLQDQITQEVKKQVRNLRKAWRQIAIQKHNIEHSRGKLALARVKFRWGKANNFDMIEAEKELRQAQVNFIKAVTDYIVGTFELRKAIGTLIDEKI